MNSTTKDQHTKYNHNSIIRQPLGPPSNTDEYYKQNFKNRHNPTKSINSPQLKSKLDNNLLNIIINKPNHNLLCIIADNLEQFLEKMPNKQLLGINASLFYKKYPNSKIFLKNYNIKLSYFASMFPSRFIWNNHTNILLLPKPKSKSKLTQNNKNPMYAYCYKCIGLIDIDKYKINNTKYCIWCSKT